MKPEEQIAFLLSHPEELIKKKPFTRGTETASCHDAFGSVRPGEAMTAVLPDDDRIVVTQDQFLRELDPDCHKVLFDDNIPSITVKTKDNRYIELEFKKMAVPFQKMIRNKHVLFLCGYGIQHTLDNVNPTKENRVDFATFKKYWKKRNQDGMRTRMVSAQKSCGDGGLLYYFDRHGEIKSKLISYEDGYVICSHNDANGDRLMECLYYRQGQTECIDCYDDANCYRFTKDNSSEGSREWTLTETAPHGFPEIPLVTKRGEVPWNGIQSVIEVYEIIYNIFLVIQKRHGWGVLYIKGKFADNAKKIAGAVVLNDQSVNNDGDAKYLTAPNPEGMLDTMKLMEDTIQKGSGTTFILPKDISSSGDISGVAVQITQSLDNEEALRGVIDWQNVASKMSRLFKFGLSVELMGKGDATAVTRFASLDVSSSFKQWMPRNDYEYNQMLQQLKAGGLISAKTGIEKNTESTPDEEMRVMAETEAAREAEMQAAAQQEPTVEEE